MTHTQVEKSDLNQFLRTAQYRARSKHGEMPVLGSWYLAKCRHYTGLAQSQYWLQALANNRLRSHAEGRRGTGIAQSQY